MPEDVPAEWEALSVFGTDPTGRASPCSVISLELSYLREHTLALEPDCVGIFAGTTLYSVPMTLVSELSLQKSGNFILRLHHLASLDILQFGR